MILSFLPEVDLLAQLRDQARVETGPRLEDNRVQGGCPAAPRPPTPPASCRLRGASLLPSRAFFSRRRSPLTQRAGPRRSRAGGVLSLDSESLMGVGNRHELEMGRSCVTRKAGIGRQQLLEGKWLVAVDSAKSKGHRAPEQRAIERE